MGCLCSAPGTLSKNITSGLRATPLLANSPIRLVEQVSHQRDWVLFYPKMTLLAILVLGPSFLVLNPLISFKSFPRN